MGITDSSTNASTVEQGRRAMDVTRSDLQVVAGFANKAW